MALTGLKIAAIGLKGPKTSRELMKFGFKAKDIRIAVHAGFIKKIGNKWHTTEGAKYAVIALAQPKD
jgi:hypothetical protein